MIDSVFDIYVWCILTKWQFVLVVVDLSAMHTAFLHVDINLIGVYLFCAQMFLVHKRSLVSKLFSSGLK